MYISIYLEESYLDSVNGTLTVNIIKHWKNNKQQYERLLSSIPGIPIYQAKAMYAAVKSTSPETSKSNIFKLVPTVIGNDGTVMDAEE